ncbi:hypothetical+protein [Methylocapsa aurea]|uniref:hypothetical protein n=1 Tax=Methylocapsa aurea TaxID=663610 RepID=UPI003D18EBCA
MEDASSILIPAAVGALLGVAFAFFARWSERYPQAGSRRALAYGLIATAALYVGLSFASDNPKAWFGIEMTGFAIFGSFALLGLVGSPWWLAIGFALHPLWHLQFHYLGTGAEFAPTWFTLGLTGFDLAVAAYVVYAVLRDADPALQRKARRPAILDQDDEPQSPLTRNERRAAKKPR